MDYVGEQRNNMGSFMEASGFGDPAIAVIREGDRLSLEKRVGRLEEALAGIRDYCGSYINHDIGEVRALSSEVVMLAHAALSDGLPTADKQDHISRP